MSTKIYNGLLIDFPSSFSDLRTELVRLAKEEIQPAAELEFTKMVAQTVFSEMDKNAWANRHIVAQDAPKLSELTVNAWTAINDEIYSIKTTNKRSPVVDYEFCITLFPLSNKILAIPFCEQKSMLSVLKNQPYVKEYGYWNNTDKPDEISDYEWETRSKDWDAAFGNNSVPAESGFTIHLVREGYSIFPEISAILENRPSMDSRVNKVFEEEKINIVDSFPDEQKKAMTVTDMITIMENWACSDDGKFCRYEVDAVLSILEY